VRYREPNRADWIKSIVFLALYVGAITAGAFLLLPRGGAGAVSWAVIVLGGLLLVVWWHSRSVAFRCANCSHEFEISLLTDLLSPHGTDWHYLKCPRCGKRTRARVLVKHRDSGPPGPGRSG
jgi:DNA-directed RNA polymerase subunit RPC12/RpoP